MTGFIEDMMMRQEGLDDQDIAGINAALPDIQALDQAFAQAWPRVAKLTPLFTRVFGKIIQKQRELK
ncbi:MAG: hypothetical protein WB868_06065 [Xanthobacteraceae bacterium]